MESERQRHFFQPFKGAVRPITTASGAEQRVATVPNASAVGVLGQLELRFSRFATGEEGATIESAIKSSSKYTPQFVLHGFLTPVAGTWRAVERAFYSVTMVQTDHAPSCPRRCRPRSQSW